MADGPPRRRRGRPPLDPDDTTTKVCLALPTKQFDEYCRRALRRGQPITEIIRADLRRVRWSEKPDSSTR